MKTSLKSILNATWKVGLGLIGAGVAVFTILLAIAFCESHYGRYEWCDRTLSDYSTLNVPPISLSNVPGISE